VVEPIGKHLVCLLCSDGRWLLAMNFGQGGDVSHEKDKDAANGKPGVQKQPSGNEGALAREAVNTSKPAAESVVSNSN
jgi:hypothetical protein